MKTTTSVKAYLVLLLVFCLCLNGGLLAMAAASYRQAYERQASLLKSDAVLFLQTLNVDPSDDRAAEEILLTVFREHGLILAQNNWVNFKTEEAGVWSPPKVLLTAAEDKAVLARVTLNGKPCLAYSILWQDDGEGGRLYYHFLYDISDLEKEHRLLALEAVLASLVLSALFALLSLRLLKQHAVAAPAEAETKEAPSSEASADGEAASLPPEQDLGALCRSALERYEATAEEKGIALGGSAMPRCTVRGEAKALTDLLDRILTEALAVSVEGDPLSLHVTREGGAVTLALRLNAPLSEETRDRLASDAGRLGGALRPRPDGIAVRWEGSHE